MAEMPSSQQQSKDSSERKEIRSPVPYLAFFAVGFLVIAGAYYFSMSVERSNMDLAGTFESLRSRCHDFQQSLMELEVATAKLAAGYSFHRREDFSELSKESSVPVAESFFPCIRVVVEGGPSLEKELPFAALSQISYQFRNVNLSMDYLIDWRPFETVPGLDDPQRDELPTITAATARAINLAIQHHFHPDFNTIDKFRQWLLPFYVFLLRSDSTAVVTPGKRRVSCSVTTDGHSCYCVAPINSAIPLEELRRDVEAGVATMIAEVMGVNKFSPAELKLFQIGMNLRACDRSLRYLSLQERLLAEDSGLPLPGSLAPLWESLTAAVSEGHFIDAFFHAKHLVFHKSLLPQLYMEPEQQFAILAPLFLSMLLAIISGTVRWYRLRRRGESV